MKTFKREIVQAFLFKSFPVFLYTGKVQGHTTYYLVLRKILKFGDI